MTGQPQISIILPTHNRADVLGRAVRSVLAQTFDQLELIVVDDASTDATAELVAGFDDPRIRYLRVEKQGGAAVARNLGVRNSSASLLAFQDSDDEWTCDKLRDQYQAYAKLGKDKPCLVCCSCIFLMADGAVSWRRPDARVRQGDLAPDNLLSAFYSTPTWLMPRTTFELLGGFDESMPNLEDWEMYLRLYSQSRGANIIVLEHPFVIRHKGDDSLNDRLDARLESLQEVIARHAGIWKNQPKALASLYVTLGRTQYEMGRMRDGRDSFVRALKLDRTSPRLYLQWVFGFLGAKAYRLQRKIRT